MITEKAVSTALEERFRRLADEWKAATRFLSSSTEIAMHPAYQKIIGIGPPAIPYILRDLERTGDHWFWALHVITDEDPVPEQSRGRISEMTGAWLTWGRDHGYV